MASRFTALPLSSGEAFVLETDNDGKRMVILVDGGQSTAVGPSKNGLYRAIREHCPGVENIIDIAICTHRDKDHAGGFPAFVETWLSEGNDIGEFWLPGGWGGAVEYALTDPDRLVSMVLDGATAAAAEIENGRDVEDTRIMASDIQPRGFQSIESLLDQLRKKQRKLTSSISSEGRAQKFQQSDQALNPRRSRPERAAKSWGFSLETWRLIQADLETSELHSESLSERMQNYLHQASSILVSYPIDARDIEILMKHVHLGTSSVARTLALGAIETAETIRAIASSAAAFDVPVRWFDFEPFESGSAPEGGEAGFLIPLNSIEVKEIYREENTLALFSRLKLTEQNVASLVFQRVETAEEPAVIFLADSRLAFGVDAPQENFGKHLKPVNRPTIYTAAHHGSRNNDHAYLVLKNWLGDLYSSCSAIRNGGVWNQTLDGFLKIDQRRCAQCYQCHGGDWSQLVQINTSGADWSWPSDHGRKCGNPKNKTR